MASKAAICTIDFLSETAWTRAWPLRGSVSLAGICAAAARMGEAVSFVAALTAV